jgi:DNA-directed RNA polymerase subunit RPC12/RpoP
MEFNMAIVNEIKCARCDRKYSGVRSRCPYCGARRIGRGKYSEESDNAKGKMIISVLIMAVFAVAAGILLFSTPVDAVPVIPEPSPGFDDPDDGIISLPGLVEPTPSPTPEPPQIIQPQITSMLVSMAGSDRVLGGNDNNFTLARGETLGIRATIRIEPVISDWDDLTVEFVSSNEEVFNVEPTAVGAGAGVYGATLRWVGRGSARLTVTATYLDHDPVIFTVTVHGARP